MSEVYRIKAGNGNCYIVSENGNSILVDTGREKYREKILKECKKFNIKLILLTHGHLDHCQNASFLSDKLNVPIAMNKNDVNLIPNNIKQPLSAKTFLGKIVCSVSIKSFEKENFEKFKTTIYLKDKDTLKDWGINAKIIDLPGHTNGSVGLDIDENKLIVGDALMNMFYPTVSMLYTNRKDMIESAKKISQLGERIIYFGHGKPLKNRIWIK